MMHETPLPTREQIADATALPIAKSLKVASYVLMAIGVLVFLVGAFTGSGSARVWQALHYNWLFFTSLSSAGVMFVAAQRITTARWSRPIIRMMEGYVAFLPVAFVLLVAIVTVGRRRIFPFVTTPPTVPEKAMWLDLAFFTPRVLVTFAIITLLSLWYIYTSVRLDVAFLGELGQRGSKWARGWRERMQRDVADERREIHSTHSLQGKLAIWLAFAFAFGWVVLAWDLSMSLDVHFQSTLYGWWFFMGGWLAALMSFALIVMAWRRYLNVYDLITETHFHDLGKLCFAFTAFWGYLTFGQYLVIWYGNVGEETHFMRLRLIGGWKWPTIAVTVAVFVVPFFGLLSRAAKVFLPTFVVFAISSLLGLWTLRYLEVYPSIYGVWNNAIYHVWELGVSLGMLGLWGWCYMSFMDAFPRMRTTLMTSPFRDEVQVPVDPETMEPLPAHE